MEFRSEKIKWIVMRYKFRISFPDINCEEPKVTPKLKSQSSKGSKNAP